MVKSLHKWSNMPISVLRTNSETYIGQVVKDFQEITSYNTGVKEIFVQPRYYFQSNDGKVFDISRNKVKSRGPKTLELKLNVPRRQIH